MHMAAVFGERGPEHAAEPHPPKTTWTLSGLLIPNSQLQCSTPPGPHSYTTGLVSPKGQKYHNRIKKKKTFWLITPDNYFLINN